MAPARRQRVLQLTSFVRSCAGSAAGDRRAGRSTISIVVPAEVPLTYSMTCLADRVGTAPARRWCGSSPTRGCPPTCPTEQIGQGLTGPLIGQVPIADQIRTDRLHPRPVLCWRTDPIGTAAIVTAPAPAAAMRQPMLPHPQPHVGQVEHLPRLHRRHGAVRNERPQPQPTGDESPPHRAPPHAAASNPARPAAYPARGPAVGAANGAMA